jgi:hypothetical protein
MSTQVVTEPDWHDGTLCSVGVDRGRTLTVQGELDDGSAVRVVVMGIERLRVDTFLEENIVGEVLIVSGPDSASSAIEYLSQGDGESRRAIGKGLHDGYGRLVVITCMIGCRLVAYFTGEFTIESPGRTEAALRR